jgi:hypothetical protein
MKGMRTVQQIYLPILPLLKALNRWFEQRTIQTEDEFCRECSTSPRDPTFPVQYTISKMDMDMAMTASIPSATMSMVMPTITSAVAATTTAAMSMSMGGGTGCKLSVRVLNPQFLSLSRIL